ncbi:MAG: hypothetical protein PF574_07550 [Candidatus Delongbacteria bacterium]|jgi:hypothetical protein|nr:hypothetical protein [Candidatus Delongbacteria bacterium]
MLELSSTLALVLLWAQQGCYQCDCPDIVRYSYTKVENLFKLPIQTKLSMKQLEKRRTGINRFFPTERSGWIEVCLL